MTTARKGLLLALALGALAATAGAELLHVETSSTALDFAGAAGMAYDAGSDDFTLNAAVTSLKIGEDSRALPAGASLRIRLRVSAAGVAATGAADQDLEITGTLDLDGDGVAEYASPLLTGTFHGFGYENGAPDKFDFRFQTTGGSLAGVFGEMVGVAVQSTNSTFTGRFNASFAGDASGTLGSVAGSPAGVMDLAGGGATTLAGEDGPAPAGAPGGVTADDIYAATGVTGGLIVDVGCGNGQLTVDLHKGDAYLVHGIDTDAADVQAARDYIASQGVYGPVAADRFSGTSLPYIDNLVRLFVIEDLGTLTMDEVMRALAPEGIAYIWNGSAWEMHTKPRPADIDHWPQHLYDATNNAVSHDVVAGPPRHLQWIGGPWWSRHHDRMASCSTMVEDQGRLFYIMDEGPVFSIMFTPNWNLVARDAFNGTVLWRRQIRYWHSTLIPFKSGPAQPGRRLVADGARVYATLGLDDPVSVLDAIDGHTVRVLEDTVGTEEIALSNGVLFCMRRDPPTFRPQWLPVHRKCSKDQSRMNTGWAWSANDPRDIVAVDPATGNLLWAVRNIGIVPLSLTVDADHVYYHNGTNVVCLDRTTGAEKWTSPAIFQYSDIAPKHGAILISYGDYVLFVDSDKPGDNTANTITCLDRETGTFRWDSSHLEGGHHSPDDLLVLNGMAWSGTLAKSGGDGKFEGRRLTDGSVGDSFLPESAVATLTKIMHHRCHRIRATEKYFLASRMGIEFVDPAPGASPRWEIHHWIRGGCIYGLIPANGMVYCPAHSCACYLQSKTYGFTATAPVSPTRVKSTDVPAMTGGRLEQGPAYAAPISGTEDPNTDWPQYRHDVSRSGTSPTAIGTLLRPKWRKAVGGRLSALTGADGRLYVCSVDKHRLFALDAESGDHLWSYTAGGRIDSPPTLHNGRVLFGSTDGYVYCLRASDGELAWRFRAAPVDQRQGAFNQVESVWPVNGSVLVYDRGSGPVAHVLAGRILFLDGGLRMMGLDPATGALLYETLHDEMDPDNPSQNIQYRHDTPLNSKRMPVALPDILSCDDDFIYMRAQRFDFAGVRQHVDRYAVTDQSGTGAHLFGSTGFLDDSWFHRTYWIWGKDQNESWAGWMDAARQTAAGRILSKDGSSIYGYGRYAKYVTEGAVPGDSTWDAKTCATPIEYRLFGAPVALAGWIDVLNSTDPSGGLDPEDVPFSVEAWIKVDQAGRDGAIVARGGTSHGYALYLEGGVPTFAVRVNNGTLNKVVASEAVPVGQWVHVAGVLTATPQVKVYINGVPKGTASAAGFIQDDPGDEMEIGTELDSSAGDYTTPYPFNGGIDEVRVYINRALSDAEIAAHHADPGAIANPDTNLVLYYPFNDGTATDLSGSGHDGAKNGAATTIAGRLGNALQFTNSGSGAPSTYYWERDIPLHVRAMAKIGDKLVIAGPANVVDTEYAFDHYGDRRLQARLRQQVLAIDGKLGALMHVVSCATGETISECRLSATPTFDGMAVIGGKLYISMTDGTILCYEGM